VVLEEKKRKPNEATARLWEAWGFKEKLVAPEKNMLSVREGFEKVDWGKETWSLAKQREKTFNGKNSMGGLLGSRAPLPGKRG